MPIRRDLPFIRWSLMCLFLAAGAAIFAALYGKNLRDREERELHAARQRLEQIRRTADDDAADAKETERYRPAYEAMLKRGLVANGEQENETRFRLLSVMEGLRELHPLPHFSFSILSAQTDAALPASTGFELRGHVMNMRLGLLHEGQLLALLGALKNEASAPFFLERCAVERDGDGLSAECTGSWMALAQRAGT